MKRTLTRWTFSLLAALTLALFLTLTPALASTQSSGRALKPASSHISSGSVALFQGTVTSDANVRSAPDTSASIKNVAAAGTVVTVYAQVTGSSAWAGNLWYRISPMLSAPLFIYSGLVEQNGSSGGPAPSANGKVIVVYISKQWLYAYDNGQQVFNAAVTTAQPGLVTPTGTYHIFSHKHPTIFYSPWPKGSPYYYPPTFINYAMGWRVGGYYIHDSSWRSVFGPGTNVPHQDPKFGWLTGTHGCITAALDAIIWLYNWAPNGTTVIVNR
ncbi:MAG TPA: L,D-transpeptidase family protein [Ktedonobacterales bacterium]|jgi:lipoprotein-anchoring transpeptidase ErfK/SrfK